MSQKELRLDDKEIFLKYLSYQKHQLSFYSWPNIFIWKGLYRVTWEIIEGSLCIFFQDSCGTFLYLPPLGFNASASLVAKVFEIMDSLNKNPAISRIENVEEDQMPWFKKFGYKAVDKFPEYLYRRKDLVELRSDRYKSQRASYNFFLRHYRFNMRPYSVEDKIECLKLYENWSTQRAQAHPNHIYCGMLKDSYIAFQIMLDNYADLDILGLVVEVDNKLAGFSFGFCLNKDTFCILYEVVDLAIKGAAQFIFREFCRSLSSFTYINAMDDSGLANLKTVKQSYRPLELIPSYIITRRDSRQV